MVFLFLYLHIYHLKRNHCNSKCRKPVKSLKSYKCIIRVLDLTSLAAMDLCQKLFSCPKSESKMNHRAANCRWPSDQTLKVAEKCSSLAVWNSVAVPGIARAKKPKKKKKEKRKKGKNWNELKCQKEEPSMPKLRKETRANSFSNCTNYTVKWRGSRQVNSFIVPNPFITRCLLRLISL